MKERVNETMPDPVSDVITALLASTLNLILVSGSLPSCKFFANSKFVTK